MAKVKETSKRSVIKAVSWRLCATATVIIIVYALTKELTLALEIGLIEMIAKMSLYYLHERLWGTISWGYITHPLSSLEVKNTLTENDLATIRDRLKELGYVD